MEILDCFCGVGPWATRDPLLPHAETDMLALLDHFGIARALVYDNGLKFLGRPKDALAHVTAAARRQPRFIPAAAIDVTPYATAPSVDGHLAALREAGIKALWLKLPCTPYRLVRSYARWYLGDWLNACSAHRLPVLLHAEDEAPELLHNLCTEFPELRVIATGILYTGDAILYPLLRAHANLRVCLGHMYIPAGNPAKFLRHFPAERLLFGSGLPEFSPGGLIAHVMYADISDTDKARILGGNLQALIEEVRL